MKSVLLWLSIGLFLFSKCSWAQSPPMQDSAGKQEAATHFFTKDMTVYVSDFELAVQNVKVDNAGIVNLPPILQTPQQREAHDPAAQARKLVNLMSVKIIADLHKAGYKAKRLATSDPLPASGAWVHGVFAEVVEGNRLQRTIVGFGSGAATMDLIVTLTDLASPEKPLSQISQGGTSGNAPGAATSMNPYVAAAKFVLEKNATEKTVVRTASAISAEIVKQLKAHEIPPATH